MQKTVLGLIVATAGLSISGCGCGLDVRRYAKRVSAPDVETEAAPKKTAATAEQTKAAGAGVKNPAPKDATSAAPAMPTATTKSTASALPPAPPIGPLDSNEKPSQSLSEVERRARSIANLEKIGRALAAYMTRRGKLPPLAVSRDGDLLLSWRVIILPELGYPELYARFRPDEPWDSKRNKPLLEHIPAEYQSPERFDLKTNYLAVAGRGMPYSSDFPDGVTSADLKDGADNTVAVVEVDDKYAQEWTRPVEHTPLLDRPSDKLGGLRGEGAFGAMASGRVVLLPRDLTPSRLAALFTPAGGEPIDAATLLAPPSAQPPPTAPIAVESPAAANPPPPSAGSAANRGSSSVSSLPVPVLGLGSYVPDPAKEPLPDEESLAKSRALLKELYRKDYEQARARPEREQFMKKLLDDAKNVEQTPADFYELLRTARDMAAALGDVSSVLKACQLLEQRFQMDPLPTRLSALEDLNKHAKSLQDAAPAKKEARRLAREAFNADRYDVALPAHELVRSFAHITATKAATPATGSGKAADRLFGKGSYQKIGTPDSSAEKAGKSELARLDEEGEMLEAAKSLYATAQQACNALQDSPNDAAANEAVGRYLCCVKNDWETGLPYLAKAGDIRLRGIASLELAADRSPRETLSLADQYWDLAGRFKQPQRRGLQLRAVYCYQQAAAGLAGGLEKTKIQRRIDEAAGLYGREEIDRVLAPLPGIGTKPGDGKQSDG